jgi:hypothetical protein
MYNLGNNFKSESTDPMSVSELNLLISTIPLQPVGAESILKSTRREVKKECEDV